MMKTVYIYSLSDPNTNEIRYIGKTVDPFYRFWNHIHEARHNKRAKNEQKLEWIRGLLANGLRPILSIIEEIPTEIWEEREMYWIAKYKEEGSSLLNVTKGGRNGVVSKECRAALAKCKDRGRPKGWHHTDEARAKIKAKRALQVITEEHRHNISIAIKGKKRSEEQKQKVRGVKKSEIGRQNIARGRIGVGIKKVQQITPNGEILIFDSSFEVAYFYNTDVGRVHKQCNNPNIKSKKLKGKFSYI